MLVLDSTILIDHLRGRPARVRVAALVDAGETLATTAINVEEVVRGLRERERLEARRLFEGLLVLPIGREEAWTAGDWRREAGARGRTVSQADCLVAAATSIAHGRLATSNVKDFAHFPIEVEHWRVGR